MISEGNEYKSEILHAISSVDSGLLDCEYENNLFKPQYHDAAITALKDMLNSNRNQSTCLIKKIKNHLKSKGSKQKTKKNLIENLTHKYVAYYPGISHSTSTLESIKKHNISMLNFARMHKLSGTSIFNDNRFLAFKKAGAILLDAYDAGAEVLIIEDMTTYNMMQNHFTAIEKIMGRKMSGLELITSKDFMLQLA